MSSWDNVLPYPGAGRARNGGRDAAMRASEISKKTLEEYEEPPMEADLKDDLKSYVDRRRKELGD